MVKTSIEYFTLSCVYPGGKLREQAESEDADLELVALTGVSAVYLWVKRLAPPARAVSNKMAFSQWIESALSRTDGVVHGTVGHLGHAEFTLGRRSISSEKLAALEEITESYDQRKIFQKLFSQLDYSIALYVGETNDLAKRVRDHLGGTTGFAKRLHDYGHTWDDVGLRFVLLPPTVTLTQRQAVERIVASMLLAPATSRSG